MRDGIAMKWTSAFAILTAIGSIIAAHFNGIHTANSYTDLRVADLKGDITRRLERLEDKQDKVLDILKKR